jgi:hypothetical protein
MRWRLVVGRCAGLAALTGTLANCDDTQGSLDALKSCTAATEQTVLLRQMTMADNIRKQFDYCRQYYGDKPCRGLYLDADGAVGQCMKDAGYIFLDSDFYVSHGQSPYKTGNMNKGGELRDDVCSWRRYQESSCYHRAALFKLTHWWAF